MNAYRAILTARFRSLLQYRAAALGGLFTQSFFGLVRIMILDGFYRSTSAALPMRLGEVVGYVWLGQALLLLVPWRVDADVREQVRSGTVVYELCRPLDLYGTWFVRALAWRTAPVMLRMLPMFVVAMALAPLVGLGAWRLAPPPGAASLALWLASLVGALFVSCAITTLMSVSLLWTVSADGIPVVLTVAVTVFGGLVIPLPLFPDWARPIVYALPFAGVLDFPARIYTGNIPPAAAGWVLVHQLWWTIVLVALGRWLLGRGIRRLVTHGG
jgi:ABC-2 type transport system permease protein